MTRYLHVEEILKSVSTASGRGFPTSNLPYGVFRKSHSNDPGRIGVALGDYIVDLHELCSEKKGASLVSRAAVPLGQFTDPSVMRDKVLNRFIQAGSTAWKSVRSSLLQTLADPKIQLPVCERRDAEMLMPVDIPDYTDFYSSIDHATNVGKLFRPGQPPLLENWKHIPIGYHGRASTIVVSGTKVQRPSGMIKMGDKIAYSACKKLDFEVELGYIIGGSTLPTSKISVDEAEESVFGCVVVNDWSARDIQQFEYVPLGPFLSKNFATTISPWIVPYDSLKPFLKRRALQSDPTPAPYTVPSNGGTLNFLDCTLKTSVNGGLVSQTNSKNVYWSISQQIAHHSVGGCVMRSGDLLATGTISGPSRSECGSLLELTLNGTESLKVPSAKGSETKDLRFLEDGDTVEISASCGQPGSPEYLEFGPCSGTIVP